MSAPAIRAFELQRAELPLGRMIGDNDCRYDSMSVIAVRLRTDDGDGWGCGDAVSYAAFNRPAWYLEPLPPLVDLIAAFEAHWWPRLKGRAAADVQRRSPRNADPLALAVDLALWDLRGMALGVPVWSLLAEGGSPRRVRAYGSLLDFPLDHDEAAALARRFVARGFRALKVKVGAPDCERDVARLVAVREAVGPDVEITADANAAWDVQKTLARLAAFERAGIRLGYLEDPLPYDDLDGFARLATATDVPLVAHDYAPDAEASEALMALGAIDRMRVGAGGITGMLQLARAARAAQTRMIAGNTLFEYGAHVAVALDGFDRLEFSDLAWNDLLKAPMEFIDGFVLPPERPGLGLDPRPGALEELARER
jgi:L-alanine-DL-glutamate epimerase-like enolase superfamily enzyme